MATSRDDRVRERAQAIWEREGRPEGKHEEHWRRAIEEIDRESAGPFADSAPGAGGAKVDGNGLATSLQPGGTVPGDSPANSVGSIGTGGGSTANQATGDAAKPAL
jgi:hypothetical protein